MRTLREHGAAVLFISHRLEEVFAICDTVTVMRDGAVVHDARIADITPDEIVRRMVGRELSALFPKQDAEVGATGAAASTGSRARACSSTSASRSARARSSRSPASSAPAAARSRARSSASTAPTPATSRSTAAGCRPARPRAAMRAGIGFVPEDRRQQGLVMDLSIARNATLTRLRRARRARAHPLRAAENAARARVGARGCSSSSTGSSDPVGTLSGGNQQKVVLGKWLATEPKLLIVDEPTRGIDVGTKAEVHRLLSELAGRGVAVLMISSELPEVLGMADRVLVMHEGRLTGELAARRGRRGDASMRAATGQLAERARRMSRARRRTPPRAPARAPPDRVGLPRPRARHRRSRSRC